MNIAVIFAGGTGTRMHSKDKPKQFLEIIHNKPLLRLYDSVAGIITSIKAQNRYLWKE